ncbi:MAG: GDSL-type esterase/lipase family protein [Clostridia bacterium]
MSKRKARRIRRVRVTVLALIVLTLIIIGIVAIARSCGKSPESAHPATSPVTTLPVDHAEKKKNAETFDDTVFVGNSYLDTFSKLGIPPKADVLWRVGLTVRSVFHKSTAGGSVPIIEELNAKNYKRIILVFGENELGWVYPNVFIRDYKTLIETVRKKQPHAQIFVQSIFPVSSAVNIKNEENTNNNRIAQYNKLLRTMSDEVDATFIDSDVFLKNELGNLPDNAASDGVHLNKAYSDLWIENIRSCF